MDWTSFIFNLAITATFYMFIPVVLVLRNGQYSTEKAKKIAIINAIVVAIIFIIIRQAANINNDASYNAAPAFLWGYISYGYMVNAKIKNKKKYCKNCGQLLKNRKCTNCSKKSNSRLKKILKRDLLYLGFILFLIFIIFSQYNSISQLNKKVSKKDERISFLERQNNQFDDRITELWEENWDLTAKANFLDNSIVMVVSGWGNYYYTYDCVQKKATGNYTFWAYNKEAAISKGYRKGSC